MPTSSPAWAPAAAATPQEQESADLIKFREEWLAELQRRNQGSTPGNTASTVPPGSGEAGTSQSPKGQSVAGPAPIFAAEAVATSKELAPTRTLPTNHPALSNGQIMPPSSTTLQNALNIYRRAVEHEKRSELDEAIVLYRQAFRLDDYVDRAYRREEMLQSVLKEQENAVNKKLAPASGLIDVEELSASFQNAVTIKPPGPAVVFGTLANLIQGFPVELAFTPEDENEPVFLNKLPEELLVMIIGKLDTTSVERFGSVSRKARMLTLDPGIWRELVRVTYNPPQIPDRQTIFPVIERFLSDYRRVYIEQPRIRLDGVYIAICHYVRPGLSENSWVNINHLITYHRYLRFFPNGQVLSLLANEEHGPQQVIPILKPTLRMKGLFLGHWKLIGTTVHLSNLIDASGRFALPVLSAAVGTSASSSAGLLPEYTSASTGPGPLSGSNSTPSPSLTADRARYVFDMTLNLRSRPIGRWNRMDILSYDSVNIETGDVNPVALKHERSFWFSKVRSYA